MELVDGMTVVIGHELPPMPTATNQMRRKWERWVASKPPIVREMCEKLPPWNYYDMPKTGQVVTVDSYSEDGTVTVTVVGDRISIPAITPFGVFGVSPDDLVVRKTD